VTPDGRDVFESKFKYLRKPGLTPEKAYQDILAKTLHAPACSGLHLCDIRGSAGEIGLKASGAEDYFGLIYIGDISTFKKLVEEDDSGITLEEDAVTGSLFDGINERDTSIDILIGAKKFMEGWNSWRVSNMGLLNIGRKEGSQIIQLFGRGVRLRGKGFSLKRSSALDGKHPDHVGLLETLNIFAVRANYMSQFREYLEKEGVETEGDVELPLEIKPNKDFLGKGLVVPRVPEGRNFAEETDILLEPDSSVRVRVDMSLKVQALESGADGVTAIAVYAGRDMSIPAASLDLVDWEKVYLELLEYKERKGLVNLVVRSETPRKILATSEPRLYNLIADESVVAPKAFADTVLLHEATVSILRKYTDAFYLNQQRAWESKNMDYRGLAHSDPNFQPYTVKIPKSQHRLVEAVQCLIEEADRIYRNVMTELPTLHFDRHLYQPLLVEDSNGLITSTPPGLEPSESRFVQDLRDYWITYGQSKHEDKDIFLLRNLTRGKGVGFFAGSGFYPDFILWIKSEKSQRIVFIEPHGMLHAKAYRYDEKARLHESLPELAKAMAGRTNLKNVTLDSFIVSATPYEDLRVRYEGGTWDKKRFAEAHILFPERINEEYDYMKRIFSKQLTRRFT
ncbi:MAG: restriction endonuclease subunit R, partial [Candidatus Latescibacteria bacterium]|nr:restriction endonuclease subunit R [Candidatus Latescibacterota bacterium]